MSHETAPSIPVKESTGVKTNLKTVFTTLGTVVVLTAAGAVAWATSQTKSGGQGEKLTQTEAVVRADHDVIVTHTAQIEQIVKALDHMDRKLDYLTGARSERPAAGSK